MKHLILILTLGANFVLCANADIPPPAPPITQPELQSKPEGVTAAWPYVKHFYAIIEASEGSGGDEFYHLIPDRYKLDFISPLLFACGLLGAFVTSIWFLVKQFQVHWGWGVGQLLANAASFALVIPGFILAVIFLIMHWHKAFNLFVLGVIFWGMLILSILMIPSWASAAAALHTGSP